VLEQIVEAVLGTRLLVLVTFRPEYEAPWMRSHLFRRIRVDALPEPVAVDLLRELLGDDPSLEPVSDAILRTAGGNPLFLEEVVHSLVESGALAGERGAYRAARPLDEIEVPGSVQSVLAERLDRLPEAERSTLETAAIVGPRVPAELLGRVLERPAPKLAESLAHLCRLDLLQREPVDGEAVYAFRHPLIQDVAYRSQLAENRAPVHARLARILSEPVEGQSEPSALVALHWERAGELEQAARANARAAQGTGSLDPVETFRLWSRTRELAARLDSDAAARLEATACVQLLNFGWRQGVGHDEVDGLFSRGRELLERAGEKGFLAMLHASYGRNLSSTLHADAYLEQAERALELARESGSEDLESAMESVLAHAVRHRGQLERSLGLMEAGLARLRQQEDESGIGFGQTLGFSRALWLRSLRSETLVFLGRLADAAVDVSGALRAATERGDPDLLIPPRYAAVTMAWARGDATGGLEPAREAAGIAERQGSPYARVLATGSLGFALLQAGEVARAAETLETALETSRESHAGLDLEARLLSLLAEARWRCDAAPAARALADEAVACARARRTPVFGCFGHLARARMEAASGPAACEEALAGLGSLVEETGARVFEPFAECVRAAAARASGDAAAADASRALAREGFVKMGADGWVARLDRGELP
jgi:adenylate cyclase